MRFTQLPELEAKLGEKDGEAVEVGFRPSGELHVGNLLSIASAAIIASRNNLTLQVTCCDTDWAAHTHELVKEDNKQVMQHYFERDDPPGCHGNLAEHRFALAEEYIRAIIDETGAEAEIRFMSELQKDAKFRRSLQRLLERTDEFDAIWDGGFRRRWKSPVAPVCDCGFSPAKGASYAEKSRSMVFPCWNEDCEKGFHETPLVEENLLGIYYLVDPIRDTSSRDTRIHVFGGDYKKAKKGQKTSQIHKVEKITWLANNATPHYFLTPLVVSRKGKPLSKSKDAGIFVSDLDGPSSFIPGFVRKVEQAIVEGEDALVVDDVV